MQKTALDCQACKLEKSMKATSIPRMSTVVRAIGAILVIPSVLGVLFSLLMFLGIGQPDADPGAGGVRVVTALGMGACSLVSGLLGYVLIMNKKVWRCASCGFVLDRA